LRRPDVGLFRRGAALAVPPAPIGNCCLCAPAACADAAAIAAACWRSWCSFTAIALAAFAAGTARASTSAGLTPSCFRVSRSECASAFAAEMRDSHCATSARRFACSSVSSRPAWLRRVPSLFRSDTSAPRACARSCRSLTPFACFTLERAALLRFAMMRLARVGSVVMSWRSRSSSRMPSTLFGSNDVLKSLSRSPFSLGHCEEGFDHEDGVPRSSP